MSKTTIGCRVTEDEMTEIDSIAGEMGVSRSEWLYQLIREALGLTPVETVRSLATRVKALEERLGRLAK